MDITKKKINTDIVKTEKIETLNFICIQRLYQTKKILKKINNDYDNGFITNMELKDKTIDIWIKCKRDINNEIIKFLNLK